MQEQIIQGHKMPSSKVAQSILFKLNELVACKAIKSCEFKKAETVTTFIFVTMDDHSYTFTVCCDDSVSNGGCRSEEMHGSYNVRYNGNESNRSAIRLIWKDISKKYGRSLPYKALLLHKAVTACRLAESNNFEASYPKEGAEGEADFFVSYNNISSVPVVIQKYQKSSDRAYVQNGSAVLYMELSDSFEKITGRLKLACDALFTEQETK